MFGRDAQKKALEETRQEFTANLQEMEKRIAAALSYTEDRLIQGLSRSENKSAAGLSEMKDTLAESASEAEAKLTSLVADAEKRIALLLSEAEEKIVSGFPDVRAQCGPLFSKIEVRLASGLENTESKIDARLRETEERLAAELPGIKTDVAGLLSQSEERISAGFAGARADIAEARADIAARLSGVQEHATPILPDVDAIEANVASFISKTEEKISGELSNVEGKIAARLAAIEEKVSAELSKTEEKVAADLSSLEEKSVERIAALTDQLAGVQLRGTSPRPNFEAFLTNQQQILEMLGRMEKTVPLEPLMHFAAKFALTQPGMTQPGRRDDDTRALATRFEDLLSCFGIAMITDLGEPFDPERHVIARTRHDPIWPENIILEIADPGFMMGKKLLRPASVVVNRAPAPGARGSGQTFTEWELRNETSPKAAAPREEKELRKAPPRDAPSPPGGVKNFFMWLIFGARDMSPKNIRADMERQHKKRNANTDS